MQPFTAPLTGDAVATLRTELDAHGFACLPDAVNPDFLARVRERVDAMLDTNGHRYFSIIQPQKVEGGAFAEIAEYPEFMALMKRLVRDEHSQRAVDESELYNVLRVIAGDEAATRAFEFHYDATVLTVLMPLFIPSGPPDKAGDLVAFPNARGYRRSAIGNIIEKTLLQNPLAFRYYKHRYGAGTRNVVKLQPGNLYFFWGYRTLHGNLPCAAGAKRATLLFHFGNPHAGDTLTRTVLKVRKVREARRLRAA